MGLQTTVCLLTMNLSSGSISNFDCHITELLASQVSHIKHFHLCLSVHPHFHSTMILALPYYLLLLLANTFPWVGISNYY